MTEPTDLLPCPFCGGAASLNNDTDSPCWFVGCSNSACPIEPCHYADTEAEAIATWNRRTPTPVGVGPYGYVDADRAMRAAQPAGAQQPGAAYADLMQAASDWICEHVQNETTGAMMWAIRLQSAAQELRASHGQAPAQAAPAAVAGPSEFPHEQMDVMALARYKVMPSHESMLHRHAVVAGDGSQQLYIGREVECENMARKFAGAFLDGAFAFHSMLVAAPTTQAAPVAPEALDDDCVVRRVQDRTGNWIEFDAAHELFDPVAVDAARAKAKEGQSHE